MTLIEAAPRILPQLKERIAVAVTELLGNLGVAVRVSERVTRVDEAGVHTASGAFIPGDLVVWAAGIQAPSFLADLDGLEVNHANQLVVTTTLQTTRDADAFAFGDCAACPWPEAGMEGALVPPRAQAARQQALLLVKTVKARLTDGCSRVPLPRLRLTGVAGRASAVGSLMGRLIGGSIVIQGPSRAGCTLSALYKLHQVSIHGYVRVAFDTVGRSCADEWSRGSSCTERRVTERRWLRFPPPSRGKA